MGRMRLTYLAITAAIFLVEVAIALRLIGGPAVRGSIGDALVIALIYFFLRGVFLCSPVRACALAIAAGFVAEALQYIHIVELLGFAKGSIIYTLIGNTFSVMDLLMYVIGGVLAISVDRHLLLPRWRVA